MQQLTVADEENIYSKIILAQFPNFIDFRNNY